MVSINNNLSNVASVGTLQSQVRNRQNLSTNLNNQDTKNFSAILDKSNNSKQAQKQSEVSKEPLVSYSPLMLKYGANKISEIKNLASSFGINDLSNEDFDYAIRYGRSILADYLV